MNIDSRHSTINCQEVSRYQQKYRAAVQDSFPGQTDCALAKAAEPSAPSSLKHLSYYEPMADVPTLYQWVGGAEPLRALITRFYEKVPADPLLAPLFASMPAEHFQHVGSFIAEVLGGPLAYSQQHGGHAAMVRHHLGRNIREDPRKRWVVLLLETADEQGLPDDPEFRSALVAYLEWGSRLAVVNSGLAETTEIAESPMPKWDWGVPGGPYQP